MKQWYRFECNSCNKTKYMRIAEQSMETFCGYCSSLLNDKILIGNSKAYCDYIDEIFEKEGKVVYGHEYTWAPSL